MNRTLFLQLSPKVKYNLRVILYRLVPRFTAALLVYMAAAVVVLHMFGYLLEKAY